MVGDRGYKLLSKLPVLGNAIRYSLLALTLLTFVAGFAAAQNAVSSISSALCGIYSIVHAVIFVIGLVLIIIGGAMYAIAHLLPAPLKGSLQGYGIGMVVGGVVGIIISLSSGYIIGVLASGQTGAIQNC
jgi:hypothetical protein